MADLKSQRGGTLLEACFAIVILLLFVIGILDFGRAYNVYQIATNAARESARFGVAPTPGTTTLPTNDQITTIANNFLDSGNVCPSHDCVEVTNPSVTIDGNTFTSTKVTVTVPYEIIAGQFLGLPSPTVNLTTSATMRNETN